MPSASLAGFRHQRGLRTYLDTSAVMPLVYVAAGTADTLDASRVPKVQAFAQKAAQAQSLVLCSNLVLEEIAAKTRNKKRSEIARKWGHNTWSDFERNNAPQAAIDAKTVQATVVKILKTSISELVANKISLEHPQITNPSGAHMDTVAAGEKLRKLHHELLRTYPNLDAMDALHIATGAELGCKHFVSFDDGWDGITQIMRLS